MGLRFSPRTEDCRYRAGIPSAASIVAPLINHWLGNEPRGELNIIDLPEGEDAPFEDGDVLFANIRTTEAREADRCF